MKIRIILTLAGTVGLSNGALTLLNGDFGSVVAGSVRLTDWLSVSTGTNPLDLAPVTGLPGSGDNTGATANQNDHRSVAGGTQWFTDGARVLFLESDNNTDEAGYIYQPLGTVVAGEDRYYSFTLANVGIADFATGGNAQIEFGFSLDNGATFIPGSSVTVNQGAGMTDIPVFTAGGTPYSGQVGYTASIGDTLSVAIRHSGGTARSIVTIGSVDLIPEPSSTLLLGLSGLTLLLRRRK